MQLTCYKVRVMAIPSIKLNLQNELSQYTKFGGTVERFRKRTKCPGLGVVLAVAAMQKLDPCM